MWSRKQARLVVREPPCFDLVLLFIEILLWYMIQDEWAEVEVKIGCVREISAFMDRFA